MISSSYFQGLLLDYQDPSVLPPFIAVRGLLGSCPSGIHYPVGIGFHPFAPSIRQLHTGNRREPVLGPAFETRTRRQPVELAPYRGPEGKPGRRHRIRAVVAEDGWAGYSADQAASTEKAAMFRSSRLNSTPIRWIGRPRFRYLLA